MDAEGEASDLLAESDRAEAPTRLTGARLFPPEPEEAMQQQDPIVCRAHPRLMQEIGGIKADVRGTRDEVRYIRKRLDRALGNGGVPGAPRFHQRPMVQGIAGGGIILALIEIIKIMATR